MACSMHVRAEKVQQIVLLDAVDVVPSCVCPQAAFTPFRSALGDMVHLAHALYEVVAIGAVTRLEEVEAYMACRCGAGVRPHTNLDCVTVTR